MGVSLEILAFVSLSCNMYYLITGNVFKGYEEPVQELMQTFWRHLVKGFMLDPELMAYISEVDTSDMGKKLSNFVVNNVAVRRNILHNSTISLMFYI
jgi:hypothetical protein